MGLVQLHIVMKKLCSHFIPCHSNRRPYCYHYSASNLAIVENTWNATQPWSRATKHINI